VSGEGGCENAPSMSKALVDVTVVHVVRGEEAEPAVPMLLVVPGDEVRDVSARVFEVLEAAERVFRHHNPRRRAS